MAKIMSKSTRWSIDDLKNKGLVEKDGVYVPVKSLVTKGKVEKMEAIAQMYIPKGMSDKQKQDLKAMDATKLYPPQPSTLALSNIRAGEGLNIFKKTGLIFVKPNSIEQFLLPDGTYIDVLHKFNLSPIPAPRMTQSDKWKTDPYHTDPSKRQRKPVAQYFAFRDKLLSLCQENGYKLTNMLNILFIVPFPKSYSKKKCEQLNNQPHDQKPDLDNFCKCWMDSLSNNDCKVWNIRAIKLWGYTGQIIIF